MSRQDLLGPPGWLVPAIAAAGLAWFCSSCAKQPGDAATQPQNGRQTNSLPAATAGITNTPPAALTQTAAATQTSNTNFPATNSDTAVDRNRPAPAFPRAVQNVFEMQIALARQGVSPGSIDGLIGPQTRAALRSFQKKEHLPVTGELDNATRRCLLLTDGPMTTYQVSSNDLARLQPLSPTWLGKSQQSALEYETVLELVAEKSQAHPALVRRLNSDLDWDTIQIGTKIEVPNVTYPPARRVALVTIQLEQKILEAWDENTNLLAHFPCSIARLAEKRPVGELRVAVIAHGPNYTFDPENFPESAEARELNTKLILPQGPNNPVGVAWIGLDRPGFGIHGTPNPEQVGRTESHGCFRLANWNAEYLSRMVAIGTPVYVLP